jgi:hypothetical protein
MQAISMSLNEGPEDDDGAIAAEATAVADMEIVSVSAPPSAPAAAAPSADAMDVSGVSPEGAVATLAQALDSAQLGGEGEDVMNQMIASLRDSLRDKEGASVDPPTDASVDVSQSKAVAALQEGALNTCLGIIDHDVQLVATVKEFLAAVIDLEDGTFDDVVPQLLGQITESCAALLNGSPGDQATTQLEAMYSCAESVRLHPRLYLAVSLLVSDSTVNSEHISASGTVPQLIKLFDVYTTTQTAHTDEAKSGITLVTPVWLNTVLLFLDQYGMASQVASTDANLRAESIQKGRGVWQFRKPREGFGASSRDKWDTYSEATTKLIEEAFASNLAHATYDKGGRPQRISFKTMTDVDLDLRDSPKTTRFAIRRSVAAGSPLPAVEVPQRAVPMSPDEMQMLATCCAALLSCRLDQDTMEAVMRMSLRVTHRSDSAAKFVQAGGVQALMNIRHASLFRSAGTLTSLILRHVIDDAALLRELMERQIRSKMPSGTASLAHVVKPFTALYHRDSDVFVEATRAAIRCNDKPGNFDPEGPLKSHYRPIDEMYIAPREPPTTQTVAPASSGLTDVLNVLITSLTTRLDTRCGIPEPPEGVEDAAVWDKEHSGAALLHEP